MAIRKHGTGEILRDEEQHKTASKTDWTDEDQDELDEENRQADTE